jgi:predicted O-methyltransferase YrrM
MSRDEEHWAAVDAYLGEGLVGSDPALVAALEASTAAGLPAIQVSGCQGKLLQLLAEIQGAQRILEIGTLGGYSTIWLARALPPNGRLITLELSEEHARVARANLARAGLSKVVEVRVGPALELLARLGSEGQVPFDFIFIDADKVSTAEYFEWALKFSRQGSLIVVDNVIRKGEIVRADSPDPAVRGMRRFLEVLREEKRVSATVIQTVGSKGYDGFALARVTSGPKMD